MMSVKFPTRKWSFWYEARQIFPLFGLNDFVGVFPSLFFLRCSLLYCKGYVNTSFSSKLQVTSISVLRDDMPLLPPLPLMVRVRSRREIFLNIFFIKIPTVSFKVPNLSYINNTQLET